VYSSAKKTIRATTANTAATRQSKDIVDFLEKQVKEIEDGRYKVCEATDTPLQNIIDEIVGHYLSTLYKLKFLA